MSAPTKPDREPDASSVNGGGEKPSEAACGRHRQTPFAVSTWSRRHMAPGACTSVAEGQRKNKRRLDARAA